jgi:hypothetical protein
MVRDLLTPNVDPVVGDIHRAFNIKPRSENTFFVVFFGSVADRDRWSLQDARRVDEVLGSLGGDSDDVHGHADRNSR